MTGSRPAAAQGSIDELVQRAAGRDAAAFARIVRIYNEDMTRVAFVILGDLDQAADATETAWLGAWHGLRRTRRPEALGPWLCSLSAAEAVRLARRRSTDDATARELDGGAPDRRAPEPDVDAGHARAISRLDPDDRALLALRHAAGLSIAELRQAVRRTRPPVETRLERLVEDVDGSMAVDSGSAEADRWAGLILRSYAAVAVRQVDADALARRARAEESFERTRVISVAISIVVGVVVALHPHLAAMLFRT